MAFFLIRKVPHYSKIYFFTFIILALQFTSCSEKQLVSPEDSPRQLIFNHGGGFAGTYTTYYLLENGQVFKGNELYGSSSPIKNLPKNITDQVFKNYDILRLGENEITSYGNFNYTIIYKDEDGEKKSVWEKNQKGSESHQLFYKSVMGKIKRNNGDYSDQRKEQKFEIQ